MPLLKPQATSPSDVAAEFENTLSDMVRLSPEEWRRVGEQAVGHVVTRTLQGLDETGSLFVAYTEGYAKLRQSWGLGTTPDLWVTGDMLTGIQVQQTEHGFVLVANTPAEYVSGKRPFLGIEDDQTIEQVEDDIRAIMVERFGK